MISLFISKKKEGVRKRRATYSLLFSDGRKKKTICDQTTRVAAEERRATVICPDDPGPGGSTLLRV